MAAAAAMRPTDRDTAVKLKVIINTIIDRMRDKLAENEYPTEDQAAAIEKLARAMIVCGGPREE